MRKDAERVRLFESAGRTADSENKSLSGSSIFSDEYDGDHDDAEIRTDRSGFQELFAGLQRRADIFSGKTQEDDGKRRPSTSDRSEMSSVLDDFYNEVCPGHRQSMVIRHANKQLVKLYNSRAFTAGLVFSRGHFLGDVSKMVGGLLSSNYDNATYYDDDGMYGYQRRGTISTCPKETAHEKKCEQPADVHSSTLAAGKDGCVVLKFSKANLEPFFDEHPGLLLSLLGTQVVL